MWNMEQCCLLRCLLVATSFLQLISGSHQDYLLKVVLQPQGNLDDVFQCPSGGGTQKLEGNGVRLKAHVCSAVRRALLTEHSADFSYGGCSVTGLQCWQGDIVADVRLSIERESPLSLTSLHTLLAKELLHSYTNGVASSNVNAFPATAVRLQVKDFDECSGQHECSPHALCTNRLGSYTCQCRRGYIDYSPVARPGRMCGAKCGTNICRNGGLCQVDPQSDKHTCDCAAGFSGPRCGTRQEDVEKMWIVAGSLMGSTIVLVPLTVFLFYYFIRIRKSESIAYRKSFD